MAVPQRSRSQRGVAAADSIQRDAVADAAAAGTGAGTKGTPPRPAAKPAAKPTKAGFRPVNMTIWSVSNASSGK